MTQMQTTTDPTLNAGKKNPEFSTEKARKAANHPKRPGEKCGATPGVYVPIVNQTKCEGKRDCVEVCPYSVFEVRTIDDGDFARLSFVGKFKNRVHGKLMAYTPGADRCQACGLCVVACPEDAISLVKVN